jgi:hypothetical protein
MDLINIVAPVVRGRCYNGHERNIWIAEVTNFLVHGTRVRCGEGGCNCNLHFMTAGPKILF